MPYNPGNSVRTSNRRCDGYIDSAYNVALLILVGTKISEQLLVTTSRLKTFNFTEC